MGRAGRPAGIGVGVRSTAVRRVLWIGGPPGAGKTAAATRLARRHGLRLYSADTRTWAHRDRALAAGRAAARRWEAMTPAERWARPPAELLELSLHRERAAMVVDDLRALPASPLIVAEGSTLPPAAVATGLAGRDRAVWLSPTAALQRARLAAAGTAPGHARLYTLLREVIERDAREHAAPVLAVDGSQDLAATVGLLERRFAEALATGPRARTRAEWRALLREMNAALAAQVRGFHGRPWAAGDPEAVVRAFACECAAPACEADVPLRVGELDGAPVLAPGHRAEGD